MTDVEFRQQFDAMAAQLKRVAPLPKRPQWPQRKRGRRWATPPRRITRYVLAIAFSHSGTQTGTSSPINVTATVAANDTVVVGSMFVPTTCAVTSISGGGGAYSSRAAQNNSTTIRAELWSTAASGATGSASTVAVSFSGTATHAGAMVLTYTGVIALGLTNTGTGSGANPTISITTQDNNNFVVAFFCWNNAAATTVGGDIRIADDDGTISDAMGDHTVASPGTCTVSATHNAVAWAACALELRTSAGGAQPFVGATATQYGGFGPAMTVGGGRRRTSVRRVLGIRRRHPSEDN